jgi:hypothetical protein
MGLIGEIFADAGLHIDTASFARYGSELQAAEGNISNFATSSKTLLAGAFTLPAVAFAGVAGVGLKIASEFEDAGTTLTTLYGNADVAKEKFQWMKDFAAKTPFSFKEIEEGGIKLKAYGIDVERYGKTFGDTAAGMGKSFNDVIEAVADAQTGEFERLKELGVKAIVVTKANYEQLGVEASKVGETAFTYVDRSGKQMVQTVDRNNREMITSTLEAIWNEKYAGAMEARSKTISGMMSNIKDNLSAGLADIVGYDMKNMEVQTLSLMGVLSGLAGIAVTVSGGFATMSEPMQTFLVVAAAGVAGVGLLAAGMTAYGVILPMVTAGTALFGVTLSTAIWPVTLIVGGLALLAAGLVYLDEKTGLVTAGLQLMKDIFTITVDAIGNLVDRLYNWVVQKVDGISQVISNMIPPGVVSAIGGAIDFISSKFGGMATDIHTRAVGIQGDNKDTAKSTEIVGTSFLESGQAGNIAGAGYNAAASGLSNTATQAKGATSALNATTQAALSAAQATKQLWAAQNEVAKTEITKARAAKTVNAGYGTDSKKGSYDPDTGVTVIKSGTANSEYNQKISARNTTINVGTINNNGSSNNATKAAMALTSRG